MRRRFLFPLIAFVGLAGCGPGGRGGGGDGGPSNLRPSDSPDVLILGVSGHCALLSACGSEFYNPEYLNDRGTLDALADRIAAHGESVEVVPFADSFFNVVDDQGDHLDYGFLGLLGVLEGVNTEWIGDFDNPTRLVVVAHSHGTVWAHIALREMPHVPVETLIDLDGESLGWESDSWAFDTVGDDWAAVIQDWTDDNDVEWQYPIWQASDEFEIPGLVDLQDVEDVVPDSVGLNIEVAGSWSVFGIQDAEPNHRFDGSTVGIIRQQFSEDHRQVTEPTSAALRWAGDEMEDWLYPDGDDDDDDAPVGLETCSEEGGQTLVQNGTLTCGGEDGLEWDWYTVNTEAGDCIDIFSDNGAGAADLVALAVDSDLETAYGLADDYSQLDDEAPCTTDPWNGFACPAASVTAASAGAFRIAIGQWGGDGCTEGATYSISFALNGVDREAAQTHDNTSLDAFFADPGTPCDDED